MFVASGLGLGTLWRHRRHRRPGLESADQLYYHEGPDPAEELSFVRRQVITSRNVAGGRLTTFVLGGLNYQIEHHLFPKVCSVHYPAVSRVVRQAAAAHGVPYHEQPTLLLAIRSHYRMLKHFGREAGSDASGKQGLQISASPSRPLANTVASPLPQS